MNPTLASLFPLASKSCQDANPQLSPAKATKIVFKAIRGALKVIPCNNEDTNNGQIPDSKPQPNKTPALGAAVQGKTKSLCRVRVRFTGYRVRPLDPDNFAGSCKDLLDGLRHAGLLLGDEPWRIIYETEQEKVKSYANEKTVIEIEYP